jgi:hypothetical protein
MSLASYDRLFPSQDLLPSGGVGNLIAAPLFKPDRDAGRTVFVDPGTLEPYRDQWAYLSALGRMSPREVARAAEKASRPLVGSEVTRLAGARSSATRPVAAPVIRARLGAGIRLEQAELTPGLAATLRARGLDAQSGVLRAASGCGHPPGTCPGFCTASTRRSTAA